MMFRRFALALSSATAIVGASCISPVATSAAGAGPAQQLVIGTTFTENNLSPTDPSSCCIVTALSLEDLLQYNPRWQFEPELATSWAQTSPVSYVYRLRHGVTFWDGDPFNSADVVTSWNVERAASSGISFAFASVKQISAAGPYTVVVTLSHPDPNWKYTPAGWGEVFEAKFYEAHKRTFGQPGTLVMGTGPWEVTSLDPTRGAELTANPHWWGGTVPARQVSFKFFSTEASEELAFRAGQVDLDPFIIGPSSFASASNARIVAEPSCLDAFFSMNAQVPPWNDVHVRRAVAYALDRTDIIDANAGYAAPLYTMVPPQALQTVGSATQVNGLLGSLPLYPYNVAKAKTELAQSPYPHGFAGSLLEYDYGSQVNVSEVIAAELAKIGIRLQVKVVTQNTWTGIETGPARLRQASFIQGGCSSPDVSGYDAYLGSANLAQGLYNYADYAPPAVDKLLATGLATTSVPQRFAIYSQLLQRLASDEPYVPLFLFDYCVAVSNGFTIPSFDQPNFQFDDYALQVKPA
jgi:peptide/nickel transport system substrate-binding protein